MAILSFATVLNIFVKHRSSQIDINDYKSLIEDYLNNSLVNTLIKSHVPEATKNGPCILGIDEAGRGPVLGPMVYSIAYYPKRSENLLSKMKFADSKALTESSRENLFELVLTAKDDFKNIGYVAKIIAPNMISNCMLRRQKYNLNTLSHDTAIHLIKEILSLGIDIEHVYIDTVGPPQSYQEKLKRFFPKTTFTVTDKADSKFPIVSASSVIAKVIRDRIVRNWKYAEANSLYLDAFELGSGYPADPKTKLFLERSLDPVFGYPSLARFSWATITKALEKGGCKCDWNEPIDDEQDKEELKKNKAYWTKLASKTKKVEKTTNFAFPVPKVYEPKLNVTNADKFFEDRLLSRSQTVFWSH